MDKKLVGFITTTEILFDKNIDKEHIQTLLCDIENEIADRLESKFNCKVIGGKGGYIYADRDNNELIKDKI